jgi:hypothetical protein
MTFASGSIRRRRCRKAIGTGISEPSRSAAVDRCQKHSCYEDKQPGVRRFSARCRYAARVVPKRGWGKRRFGRITRNPENVHGGFSPRPVYGWGTTHPQRALRHKPLAPPCFVNQLSGRLITLFRSASVNDRSSSNVSSFDGRHEQEKGRRLHARAVCNMPA